MQKSYTLLALIALIIIGYATYKHFEQTDREIDLKQEQVKRDLTNDSLRLVNTVIATENVRLKQDISDIQNQKTTLYTNHTVKTKKDISRPASEQGEILKELIER